MDYKCTICGKWHDGKGESPFPVKKDSEGRCCPACFLAIVMPERRRYMKMRNRGGCF